MARGRGRGVISRVGKSSDRNNSAIHTKISTIPISTIISPQQGSTHSIPSSMPVTQLFLPPTTQIVTPSSTPVIQISNQSSTLTIPEISPTTDNHDNSIGLATSTQRATQEVRVHLFKITLLVKVIQVVAMHKPLLL